MKYLVAGLLCIYAPLSLSYVNNLQSPTYEMPSTKSMSQDEYENEAEEPVGTLKQAENGDPLAQYAYAKVQFQKKNYKEAAIWLLKAANQDYENAQYDLGKMFVEGQGIPKDYAKAHFMFSLSADKGFGPAIRDKANLEKIMNPTQMEQAKSFYDYYRGKSQE